MSIHLYTYGLTGEQDSGGEDEVSSEITDQF